MGRTTSRDDVGERTVGGKSAGTELASPEGEKREQRSP